MNPFGRGMGLKPLGIQAIAACAILSMGGLEQAFSQPNPRMDFAFAYDSVQKRTLLYGGFTDTGTKSDTWAWNGIAWTELTPAHTPGIRLHQTGAFDPVRNEFVIFGGLGSEFTQLNDVWIYADSDWTEEPTGSPIGQADGEMVYDSKRNVMVLFVSEPFGSPGFVETWERSGTTWEKTSPAQSPPARIDAGFAYDSNRQVCVLFGGASQSGSLDDTWEYDGNNWVQRTPTNFPSARAGHAMCFDAKRNVTVLFGGMLDDSSVMNDTWEYNGSDWSPVTPEHAPPARWVTFMAYDSDRARCVLFGGESVTMPGWESTALGDTWEYDGDDWLEPGTVPTPTASATPTESPTPSPTEEPTPSPTEEPTPSPTESPTPTPSLSPTPSPSPLPPEPSSGWMIL